MATVEKVAEELVQGDNLSREEFLRRWQGMPNLKKAELIGGMVYMPSPLSREHALVEKRIIHWLGRYEDNTPGCETAGNATWLMMNDCPQPDLYLIILPAFGGQCQFSGRYLQGAPELAVEVCLSSSSYDLHQKMDLYKAAGVVEYLAILSREKEVRWHRLTRGAYQLLPPSATGVIQSIVFPGLWLDTEGLLKAEMPKVFATLDLGLKTREHADFVATLARRKK